MWAKASSALASFLISLVAAGCILVLFSACQSTSAEYDDARGDERQARSAVDERQRQAAAGIDDAVQGMRPETKAADPAWPVAANLASFQRELLGDPAKRLPIADAIAGDAAAVRQISRWQGEARQAQLALATATARAEELEAKVVAMARELEEIRRRSFWGRIKAAGLAIAAGLVLLLVIYGLLVSGALPGAAYRLGLVPVKFWHALIRGIGEVRKIAKKEDVDLDRINQELKIATHNFRAALVDPARRREDV